MATGWMQPEACRNLLVLVESVTAPLLIQHGAPVCLELDIEMTIMPHLPSWNLTSKWQMQKEEMLKGYITCCCMARIVLVYHTQCQDATPDC